MERCKRSLRHAQPHKQRGRGHVTCLRPVHWTGYVASLLAVVLASAGAGLARYLLGDVNISLLDGDDFLDLLAGENVVGSFMVDGGRGTDTFDGTAVAGGDRHADPCRHRLSKHHRERRG